MVWGVDERMCGGEIPRPGPPFLWRRAKQVLNVKRCTITTQVQAIMTISQLRNEADTAQQHHNIRKSQNVARCSSPSDSGSDEGGPLAERSQCDGIDRSKSEERRVLPSWVARQIEFWGERVCLPEWDADEKTLVDDIIDGGDDDSGIATNNYRSNNGWQGADLCHSISSPVRISHYCVQYKNSKDCNNISNSEGGSGVGTTLTGVAHFTKNAESHCNYCHGGSMTSTMDDVIGWTAFHVTGQCQPWSGFTAQVNVSLKRPIPVGSYLKIVGVVTKTERRKVWIESRLVGGGENDADLVYCTAEGLVILKKNDAVDC